MSFEVLSPIAFAVGGVLDLGEDDGSARASTFAVRGRVIDIHQNSVDDVRDRGPFSSLSAAVTVVLWALVVRGRGRQHDDPVAGLHLAMAESPIRSGHPN